MILESITLVNFLSVGNVTQTVKLNKNLLTLVLGENKDIMDSGSKNGVGKCVGINTTVTIRNKHTGIIENITVGELYARKRNKKENN